MAKKTEQTNELLRKIQDYALEEIMGLRFGAYAKEIIQDRAIPDVRDGLKPVQRRILYDMYINHNDSSHAFMKCAKTVGDVLGKFHPHGDSSVYDAMVRMSQWWKQSSILVDIHGNNGSMDGDGPAAYRYTEARLAKISEELLKDLDKGTVSWAPNFDDTLLEPTVLPAKFPNLLVNGTNGISAGYATNIPPHNLGEIIDATIKRIESPNCRLDTILDIVKGPDFPTGGIILGQEGIVDAFTTGRGKVIIRSKYEFNKEKGKEQIIISEIPFEVNKALLVQKIDAIRIDKKLDGISEVRDESDREGLRIAIDLKANANKDVIINYLLKNTELQATYNYNMVAIVNKRPMTLGIIQILDAYIEHQKEVITKRSEFNLANYKARLNIVDGLLKMMSILDEVIKTIRASKNKQDAKLNLINKFEFNESQAEAIVMMQLYKLTNTDIVALQDEQKELKQMIKELEDILASEELLKDVMKKELREIKKNYATPRKTVITGESAEIKLDDKDLITKEQVIVTLTHEGYIKKTSLKSYSSVNGEDPMLKPGDYVTHMFEVSTLDNILVFTSLGQYLFLPVHIINDAKWKELGKHVNNLVNGMSGEERVVGAIVLDNKDDEVTIFTKNGLVKRTKLSEFIVSRYSKALTAFKLKGDDEVVSVNRTLPKSLFVTNNGYYLNINSDEISLVGAKASGIKGISLKDDYLVSGISYNENSEYLTILTNNKTMKRIKISDLESHGRAKKGSTLVKKVKSFDYKVITAFLSNARDNIVINEDGDLKEIKSSDIAIMDLVSTGSNVSKIKVIDAFVKASIESYNESVKSLPKEEKPKEIIEPKKEEVKEKKLTMSDFFDEFKL